MLFELPPSRSSKKEDKAVIHKASLTTAGKVSLKGGNVYQRINSIIALVESKLGKYRSEYILLREEHEVEEYCNKCIQNGICSIDTETDSLDPITCNLAGVCIYTEGEKSAYIPMHHVSYITGEISANQCTDEFMGYCLRKLIENNVKFVFHNAKFDIRVLKNKLNVRLNAFWDTMLCGNCLNENESHKLKDLHLKYCNSQDEESLTYDALFSGIPFTIVPINYGYLYSAGDAVKTFELYKFQYDVLKEERLQKVKYVFENIEMPMVDVIVDMEERGICIDLEFSKKLSEKYNIILQDRLSAVNNAMLKYESKIQEYRELMGVSCKLDNPINVSSPTQVAILLYDILGLVSPDVKKKRGTGEEILIALKPQADEFVNALLEYREVVKLVSTYIDKLPSIVNPNTGRIHCSFNQYGARTGRLSSDSPNLQNIPSHNKEVRRMFCAADGNVLISCDYSQQEPRTLADRSKDKHLISAYTNSKDIYAWIASKIYKLPYEKCLEHNPDGSVNKKGKELRSFCKSIVLGIMYSRGARAIGEQIGKSTKEAQKIIDTFYKEFPSVEKWSKYVLNTAEKCGFVETAWGRKRRLPDLFLPSYEFEYIDDSKISYDPLDFEAEVDISVPKEVQMKYKRKLDRANGYMERNKIMQDAYREGIRIRDNTGKIADAQRQCVNSIIQGSSADMLKLAMIAIRNDKFLQENNCYLLVPVHDEVICECPIEVAKECSKRLVEIMLEVPKSRIVVPMKVDVEITKCWYGEEVNV